MHRYRVKAASILLFLLALFSLIALFSYIQLQRMVPILNIGIGYYAENTLILLLSVLSLLKIVYELFKIEYHWEYEERVKHDE